VDVSVLVCKKEMRSLLKLTKRKQIFRGGGSVPVMGLGGGAATLMGAPSVSVTNQTRGLTLGLSVEHRCLINLVI